MADFEDSTRRPGTNVIEGQLNLRDAVRRHDQLHQRRERQGLPRSTTSTATLIVRPRGWHLAEKHVLVDGQPVSGVALRLRAVLLPQRAGR